jgi:hypothetical protein
MTIEQAAERFTETHAPEWTPEQRAELVALLEESMRAAIWHHLQREGMIPRANGGPAKPLDSEPGKCAIVFSQAKP